jgi:site-specific DNA-methyltransferase (adenine-specific)
VTDPPYSSGGLHKGERNAGTSDKYTLGGTLRQFPEFYGDNRDQRSFLAWASLWLAECRRITKPGGALLTFSDWRQLPLMTDAVQCGGWVWRGVAVWDKTEGSKPERGWFRHQAEYIPHATRGGRGRDIDRPVQKCLPGVFRVRVNPSEKQHTAAKPLALMTQILEVVPPGGIVLDPFAGSGQTLAAAKQTRLRSIGCEMSAEYCEVIAQRLRQEVLRLPSVPAKAQDMGSELLEVEP